MNASFAEGKEFDEKCHGGASKIHFFYEDSANQNSWDYVEHDHEFNDECLRFINILTQI